MNNIKSKTISIHEIEIGMTASFKKLIEFKDVKKFSNSLVTQIRYILIKNMQQNQDIRKILHMDYYHHHFFQEYLVQNCPEKVLYIHINHFTLNAQFILVMRLRQQSQL